jgi:SAM-dependent methyltransferase
MDRFVDILRCPATHQSLRWADDGDLTTADGVHYPWRDGVGCLLPRAQAGADTHEDSIREFYQNEGWETDKQGLYSDTRAFVDTRDASLRFTRKCIARLKRHFRNGGQYLLDAGSGPITHDELLDYGEHFEARVCVDLSAQALRIAHRKLGDRGVCLQGDLTNLPLKDNSMDAITCNHVIYQMPEEQQLIAFRELWRVLKPGGVAVVVYWWWPYAPLSHRLEKFAKTMGWDRGPEAADTGDSGPDLYHQPHERRWFEGQDWPFRYDYDSFRVIDNPFMRRFVPDGWRGRLFLDALFGLQRVAPRFCGKHGSIPAILIHKD